MAARAFSLTYAEESGVLSVGGDVEWHQLPQLREALHTHTDGFTRALVIDLDAVTYLPSNALGILAVARRRARTAGGSVELVARAGTIADKVLSVTGVPHRRS